MALQKITEEQIEQNQIASLPDRMTGTAAENKAAFDALVKVAIDAFNALVDTLAATGGAGEIGAEPFTGVGDAATVQEQLKAIQKNITDAAQGAIPDGGVTTSKIADYAVNTLKLASAAVTAAKIAAGAVTTEKIEDAAVTAAKLATNSVTETKIPDGSIKSAKLADGAVTDAKLSAAPAKIAYGSYEGTGTFGSSNPNVVTMDFTPYFICVYSGNSNSNVAMLTGIKGSQNMSTSLGATSTNHNIVTWGDKSVSWYCSGGSTGSAKDQFNATGSTQYGETYGGVYTWFAVGR